MGGHCDGRLQIYFDNQHGSESDFTAERLLPATAYKLANSRCGPSLDWAIDSDDSVIIDSVDVIDTALSDHRTVPVSYTHLRAHETS